MLSFSEDQAAALVPDPGTLKRGRALAGPAKWGNLGRTAAAAWGECAGSGSKPYLTGIDLTEPAFKCSCPSRVFPCKHGAGLLLLLARQPALLPAGTPPAWLADWLDKRQAKGAEQAGKAAAKPAQVAATPASSELLDSENFVSNPTANAARQKRETQRQARMQAGAEELETWLLDLLRAGLADLGQKPARFWEAPAGRLVDNQLPGLAAALRELADYPTAGPDWASRLLSRLGEVYVLLRTFLNRHALAPAARQDVEQQVGSTPKKDDLLADPATLVVADTWLVLGQYAWAEERLTGRRSWLYGQRSGRLALVLEFAFGNQAFATPLVPQGTYAGELAFYPGLLPLRAVPVGLALGGNAAEATPPGLTISQLLDSYATALAHQPWLRQWPAVLAPVRLHPLPDGRWLLHHATEPLTLPLRVVDEELAWHWLALSGGQPLTLFGEWDGQAFCPLVSWTMDDEPAPNTLANSFFEQLPDAREPVGGVAATTAHLAPAAVFSPAAAEVVSAANAPSWPQLLRLALLGTRQTAETLPPLAALPVPAGRTQPLLLAAGALALVRKAGYRPAAAPVPAPAPAPADPRPALGPRGTECLHQMLVRSLYLGLLPSYLARVAAAGRRVPTGLLVPLLQHATRSAETTAALEPALGARGYWLAALNPQWVKLLPDTLPPATADPADLSPWENGALPTRLAWLRQRFEAAPDAARTLLLAALPTEPAKVQDALLDLLADHLHPTAEPALETLLRARGQEARRRAATLLVQLPGTALTERLWARAAPLITAKRKLLGLGKVTLEITLPTTWDKSWLADGMEEKDSRFEYVAAAKGTAATVGPAAARLGNLLALLPPHRWAAHLSLAPAELLAAALASEWAVPLLPCWAKSTLLHHAADFAAAFLALWQQQRPALQQANCLRTIDWPALAPLVPPAARPAVLLAPTLERVRRQEADWTLGLNLVPAPWPRALSLAVIGAIAARLAGTAVLDDYNNPPVQLREFAWLLVQTVAPSLAPADVAEAIRQVEAIAQPHELFQPQLHTFVATLRFQAELEASLHE